jgi:hypothetical protein
MPVLNIHEAFTKVLAGSVAFVISLSVNDAMKITFASFASLTKNKDDRDPEVSGANVGFAWLYALIMIVVGFVLLIILYKHGCTIMKKWFPNPIKC